MPTTIKIMLQSAMMRENKKLIQTGMTQLRDSRYTE